MNTFNDSDILKNCLVGVEFEFYSNLPIDETAKQLGELLGKKIRVETKAHSDFEVTADEFKIEPDMSGGAKLMELVTGAQPYFAGRLMIIKVCDWIQKNGYTNDRSSIHLNLSFDKNKIDNKHRISKMNVLKFILDLISNWSKRDWAINSGFISFILLHVAEKDGFTLEKSGERLMHLLFLCQMGFEFSEYKLKCKITEGMS